MTDYGETTALLVVDVQNDFASPRGSLYVRGAQDVVPVANREVERALAGRALVAYTADWHPERTPHFARDGGVWPVHCVGGSWGAEFDLGLRLEGPVVRKGTGGEDGYSGFTMRDPSGGEERPTGLEAMLRERDIERVVILGLATDYCVKETALDAARLGFDVVVLREGVRAVDVRPGDGERAVLAMRDAGVRVE